MNVLLILTVGLLLQSALMVGARCGNSPNDGPILPDGTNLTQLAHGTIWLGQTGDDFWLFGHDREMSGLLQSIDALFRERGWEVYRSDQITVAVTDGDTCLAYSDFAAVQDLYVEEAREAILDQDARLATVANTYPAVLLVQNFACP